MKAKATKCRFETVDLPSGQNLYLQYLNTMRIRKIEKHLNSGKKNVTKRLASKAKDAINEILLRNPFPLHKRNTAQFM